MALDRLLPVSTTPGSITGDSYMDAVQEEVTGLWDRARIRLTGVSGTNTITATFVPALTAGLVDGMNALLRAAATNTGPVTLNGVAVVDGEGNALAAGALRINGIYDLTYVAAISSWCMVGYFPAAAVPVGGKLIKTLVASASSSIDFVNGVSGVVFDDTYDSYWVDFASVKPATDDVELWMRVGTGGGPTYQTTGYSYGFNVIDNAGTNSAVGGGSLGTATRIVLGQRNSATQALGNGTGRNLSGRVNIPNPEQTDYHTCTFAVSFVSSDGGLRFASGGACWTQGTAITAIRFMMETGNIGAGRFTLYGATKS
jgi:hypothetical protein